MLENDRKIQICAAGSRTARSWPVQEMGIGELYERLRNPARGTETRSEYLAMKKRRQDDKKDVGGFVGGVLRGGVRKAGNVVSRDLITLDMDHIEPGGTEDVLRRLEGLGCSYCVYSTRKHAPEAPRLRAVVPTDRPMSADEYEPVARKLAEVLDPGLVIFDRTTFEAVRLMYFPSVCRDGEYVYRTKDAPLLCVDGMLAEYPDWRNAAAWPTTPDAQPLAHAGPGGRQEDPTAKKGIVGAFCRAYNVLQAMDAFLPGVYEPVDNAPDRFTFTGGSTTGGAILYGDGLWLYSHHATDPAGGQLVNAFDLVRLHRFGSEDDSAAPGTPANRLPSYLSMVGLAGADSAVRGQLAADQYAAMQEDFGGAQAAQPADGQRPPPPQWYANLERNEKGIPAKTRRNIQSILDNDVRLAGRIWLDTFADRVMVQGPMPWNLDETLRVWADADDNGAKNYLEQVYKIEAPGKVMDELSLLSARHARDPVREYLQSLAWDGMPRLDTLFIDYLGAADTPYNRAICRKAFTAAAARALRPGAKYDQVVILSGAQGLGKSTLLCRMAHGWFSDSLTDFRGKDARELVQGVWIVELGELTAFGKNETEQVKQFISQSEDMYRAAYARRPSVHKRRCVFFGTSNRGDYLRDTTGNRRFWPVDVGVQPAAKNLWEELDEDTVGQIWAEAAMRYAAGEALYIDGELGAAARAAQEAHRAQSPWEEIFIDFLQREVPADFDKRSIADRRAYWAMVQRGEATGTVPRRQVCAAELWCEALGRERTEMTRRDSLEIGEAMAAIEGWTRGERAARCGAYGVTKTWINVAHVL